MLWWRTVSGAEDCGTGTLIKSPSGIYILTCHHVVQGFFAESTVVAQCFRPDRLGAIDRTGLAIHAIHEEDDTAVLRVDASVLMRESDGILTLDRFATVGDFSKLPRIATYVVPGYPQWRSLNPARKFILDNGLQNCRRPSWALSIRTSFCVLFSGHCPISARSLIDSDAGVRARCSRRSCC